MGLDGDTRDLDPPVSTSVDSRAASAAALLFLFAVAWLFVMGLAIGIPLLQLLVFGATQTAWVIGAALLAGWRWARPAALVYAALQLGFVVYSAYFGISTSQYTALDWVFTAAVGGVAILIGALAVKPFARR